MIKAAKPRSGRPPRHSKERLHKTRYFRVRPSLDRMLLADAKESGRSVSEEIERRLDRSVDSVALLSLLFDNRAVPAARLAGLMIRAMTLPSFAAWATDEAQRAGLKTIFDTLTEAIARDELTMEQVNAAPGAIEHKLAAFVLFNPAENWLRPASAAIYKLAPRKD